MKTIEDMNDEILISCCHSYCEEQGLTEEWNAFRDRIEADYHYCSYVEDFIDESCCYDLQMIGAGFIKPSALPDIPISRSELTAHCADCRYCL